MKTHIIGLTAAASVTVPGFAGAQSTRDYISIVGSSTVYPFAAVVAEHFGRTTDYETPTLESTGSGGGMKLFCAGVGVQFPDITNASRRIKKSEFDTCRKNGVKDVVELKIGYDGIAIANSKKAQPMNFTLRDIFLALAKEVPDPKGTEALVANPYKTWKDVNLTLPDQAIEVLGPPPTSGTRDAFAEVAMEGGCKTFDWIKAMQETDKNQYRAICHTVREDGAYVEAGENDNLIVQKLDSNSKALGIFGFSFLDQNRDKIRGSAIDDVKPGVETISDGSYPISRPLYFYVKTAHAKVIPGIRQYLGEFTSGKAWGEEGYLTDRGLIPMPADERKKFADDAKNMTAMSM